MSFVISNSLLIFGILSIIFSVIINYIFYKKKFIKELEYLKFSTKKSKTRACRIPKEKWSIYTGIIIYVSELKVNDFDKFCNEIIFLFLEEYFCGCIFRGNDMDMQCAHKKPNKGTNKKCNPLKVTENVLNALSDNEKWRSKLRKNKAS